LEVLAHHMSNSTWLHF